MLEVKALRMQQPDGTNLSQQRLNIRLYLAAQRNERGNMTYSRHHRGVKGKEPGRKCAIACATFSGPTAMQEHSIACLLSSSP